MSTPIGLYQLFRPTTNYFYIKHTGFVLFAVKWEFIKICDARHTFPVYDSIRLQKRSPNKGA